MLVEAIGIMEKLSDNIFLKYNPDTLVAIRKLYNLDRPEKLDEAIQILDSWVKTQKHFVRKEFPKEYLERVIIQLKGSIERAKSQLDKICTLRTILPEYFEKSDAKNDFKILDGYSTLTLLPRLTEDHTRVVFAKYEPLRFSPMIFFNIYAQIGLMAEYLKCRDYFNGIIIVGDFREINIINFVAQLNLTQMKEMCTIFLEGYDMRVQKFLFISTSKTIDVFVKLFKQAVSKKMAQRVHVLKSVEELHQHVCKQLLPSDYGGEEKPLADLADDFLNEMGTEENVSFFKEMSRAKTIEALRIPSQYNGDFSGLAGTFRSLSVD